MLNEKERNENKKLIDEFPFLVPLDWYSGKPIENHNYESTILDDLPIGWKNAFGKLICEDIKNALIEDNCLDTYQIIQVKEKYGTLRWYDNGNEKIQEIITKYEHISAYICVMCGEVNVPIFDNGWISPFCISCFEEMSKKRYNNIEPKDAVEKFMVEPGLLTAKFNVTRYSKEGNITYTLDCTNILERMGVNIEKLPTLEDVKKFYAKNP